MSVRSIFLVLVALAVPPAVATHSGAADDLTLLGVVSTPLADCSGDLCTAHVVAVFQFVKTHSETHGSADVDCGWAHAEGLAAEPWLVDSNACLFLGSAGEFQLLGPDVDLRGRTAAACGPIVGSGDARTEHGRLRFALTGAGCV